MSHCGGTGKRRGEGQGQGGILWGRRVDVGVKGKMGGAVSEGLSCANLGPEGDSSPGEF